MRTSRTRLMAVGAVLLCAAGAVVLWLSSASRATVTTEERESSKMAPQKQKKRRAMALAPPRGGWFDDEEAPADDRPSSPDPSTRWERQPLSPEDRAARAEQRIAELAQSVQVEPPDPVWSRETESKIRDAVETVTVQIPGTSLAKVQCGSKRCLVEGAAQTLPASQVVIRRLTTMNEVPRATIRRRNQRDGTFTFSVVLARSGYDVEGDPLGT